MAKWECEICGHIYDEDIGCLRNRIKRGTAFKDIPDDWICPDCQMGKEYFNQFEDMTGLQVAKIIQQIQ